MAKTKEIKIKANPFVDGIGKAQKEAERKTKNLKKSAEIYNDFGRVGLYNPETGVEIFVY